MFIFEVQRKTDNNCCGMKMYSNFETEHPGKTRMSGLKRTFNPLHGGYATLADYQMKEWAHILRSFGFKSKGSFINPNSGNKITIFIYTPKEEF
jgi:hypothetical protein